MIGKRNQKKEKNLPVGNQTIIENKRRKKRSIGYPDRLKQVGNNKKWKVFTNLKPGTYKTYKSKQYSEKDEHMLMKAIIAQKKSYNNEQERFFF